MKGQSVQIHLCKNFIMSVLLQVYDLYNLSFLSALSSDTDKMHGYEI